MSYLIDFNDNIATFTIDRPAMRNAVNHEVMDGLEVFLEKVEKDASVAFVVITGSGDRAFCSGGDLFEFHGLRTMEEAYPMLSKMTGLLYRLSTLPMPVIALVNGVAVGGGCEIASACDYRVLTSSAKAGFIQGTLAITSGWGGATQLFEKLDRHDFVLKFLTEAKIHTAQELKELGWATEIIEGNAQLGLSEFLDRMKSVHSNVHRAYKKLSIAHWTNSGIRERMMEEAKQCAELWESEAHHQAVNAFLSRK